MKGSCQRALIPDLETGSVLLQPVLGKQKAQRGFPFSGLHEPWEEHGWGHHVSCGPVVLGGVQGWNSHAPEMSRVFAVFLSYASVY